MNVHFFKLLQDHYFIITLYYCHVTTHYFLIITVLLLDYCKGTFHYFIIITYLLLLHYVSITTILLPDYYRITTIDCFIIPWSILWLITTWLLQLLPLLPIFITTLIPITTIITIIHLPNLEMKLKRKWYFWINHSFVVIHRKDFTESILIHRKDSPKAFWTRLLRRSWVTCWDDAIGFCVTAGACAPAGSALWIAAGYANWTDYYQGQPLQLWCYSYSELVVRAFPLYGTNLCTGLDPSANSGSDGERSLDGHDSKEYKRRLVGNSRPTTGDARPFFKRDRASELDSSDNVEPWTTSKKNRPWTPSPDLERQFFSFYVLLRMSTEELPARNTKVYGLKARTWKWKVEHYNGPYLQMFPDRSNPEHSWTNGYLPGGLQNIWEQAKKVGAQL